MSLLAATPFTLTAGAVSAQSLANIAVFANERLKTTPLAIE
jgi:hypothetical protein